MRNLIKYLFIAGICLRHGADFLFAQPWTTGLRIARSTDGTTFDQPQPFQDSCGVPSAVQWHGDTIVCVFQWARAPEGSPTWDRVAVKFAYDGGEVWTEPVPVVFEGFPDGFQRPFDPTLTVLSDNSLRMYFSGSLTMPPPGQDSLINTYSAHSTDGLVFTFEPGARVDHPTQRVIDPAVAFFNNMWHYESPAGAPQDGAFHYISPDGLTFTQAPNIPSDPGHNWTGNYLVDSDSELRFYGTGPQMWYKSSANGGEWSGYVSCGIPGADPSVVKLGIGRYVAIFVGPLLTDADAHPLIPTDFSLSVYPNPFNSATRIAITLPPHVQAADVRVHNLLGQELLRKEVTAANGQAEMIFDGANFATGIYLISATTAERISTAKMLLLK